jgi:glutamyl-tRNA synthetase
MPPEVTRLAPSPTGSLHLGNARTFMITWALARQQGWRIVLRVEDLDTPRVRPGVIESTIDTLAWLGMDWDEHAPLQSSRIHAYAVAMRHLAARELVYQGQQTRSELEHAASAPNEGDHETHAPASNRPAEMPKTFDNPAVAWRFVTPEGTAAFIDTFRGPCVTEPSRSVGDFLVWTKRGQPSYQLAVVVDDHEQGITRVVRGDDLVDSAGRQLLLMRALGIGAEPVYTHLPLVRGDDGRRLAKRHGDTRINAYRDRGVPAERIISLLARWSGITDAPPDLSASEFARRADLGRIPRRDVVFTREDDRWLLDGAR